MHRRRRYWLTSVAALVLVEFSRTPVRRTESAKSTSVEPPRFPTPNPPDPCRSSRTATSTLPARGSAEDRMAIWSVMAA